MLTVDSIKSAKSDDDLFRMIGEELDARLPNGRKADEEFVSELRSLPPGLRAMAATYELDVSLSLDDLGWHFGTWPSLSLAEETARGLDELGAMEMAAIFRAATAEAEKHWKEVVSPEFFKRYGGSLLEQAVEPLNERAWALQAESGNDLFSLWVQYARAHPDRLVQHV